MPFLDNLKHNIQVFSNDIKGIDTSPVLSVAAGAGMVGSLGIASNAIAGIVYADNKNYESAVREGTGISELNFMGIQDLFIGFSLFVAFACLLRGAYLYASSSEENLSGEKRDLGEQLQNKTAAYRYMAAAGAAFMAAGLYALLVAGVYGTPIYGSQMQGFSEMSITNQSIMGATFSAVATAGVALFAWALQPSKRNLLDNAAYKNNAKKEITF